MAALINMFQPLISKYKRKSRSFLEEDDAGQEMAYAFIKIINGLKISVLDSFNDATAVAYISKSMSNAYSHMYRESKSRINEEPMADVNAIIDAKLSSLDIHINLLAMDLKALLTTNEYTVITAHYVQGITIGTIANSLKISRQRANTLKNKALAKIKEAFPS